MYENNLASKEGVRSVVVAVVVVVAAEMDEKILRSKMKKMMWGRRKEEGCMIGDKWNRRSTERKLTSPAHLHSFLLVERVPMADDQLVSWWEGCLGPLGEEEVLDLELLQGLWNRFQPFGSCQLLEVEKFLFEGAALGWKLVP
jgi:hypothetical protein